MKTTALPLSPVNHVFVDFENIHEIDLAIIGREAVSFTLLVGPRQSKLEVPLVEKLLEHAPSVQLVRLGSSGRNALDFTLVYYVGRAVAADPTGSFHIVSKDKDYDPLIEHLQSKGIQACRHDSFATLTFAGPARLPAPKPPAAAPNLKPRAKSRTQPVTLDERTTHILEHLRTTTAARPKNKKKLVSFLAANLGHKFTEIENLESIEKLCQAGYLAIDEKGAVTYRL